MNQEMSQYPPQRKPRGHRPSLSSSSNTHTLTNSGTVPSDALRAPPPAAFALSGSEGREGRGTHKSKRSSFSMTSTVTEGVEQGPIGLSASKSGSSASKFAENSTHAHSPTTHHPPTLKKKSRDRGEHSCCGVVQESAMRAREDRYERYEARGAKAQPWIVLKMIVPFTLGLMGYAAYVYVGLLVVPMIQRRPGAEGSREAGIGLLVGFAVLWLWTLWAYIVVVLTPPGYAKDYVQKTERPRPPQPMFPGPRHAIGGPSYEDIQAMLAPSQPQIPATTIPRPILAERTTSVMTVKSVSMQSGKSKSNVSASGIKFNSGEMMNGNAAVEEAREAESSVSGAEQQNRESRASLTLQGVLSEDIEAQVDKPIEATPGGWSKWLFCCCWWMDSGEVAKPRTYIARRPPTTHVLEPLHRYCEKDGFLKPYRAHHCRNCGTCVLKYDHHCPWIGQCVGARNHKFFLNFCQAAFVCTAYIIGTMLPYTVKGFTQRGVDVNPQQLVIIALSALFALFTFSLTVTHIYMITLGQTTVENMQIATMKRREEGQLSKAFKWWEFRGKRQTLREWDREWGALDKEGNIWWIGGRRREWEAVMGKNKLGWTFPIGKSPNDGLDYPVNPRFDTSSGRWRRREEWPEELR